MIALGLIHAAELAVSASSRYNSAMQNHSRSVVVQTGHRVFLRPAKMYRDEPGAALAEVFLRSKGELKTLLLDSIASLRELYSFNFSISSTVRPVYFTINSIDILSSSILLAASFAFLSIPCFSFSSITSKYDSTSIPFSSC